MDKQAALQRLTAIEAEAISMLATLAIALAMGLMLGAGL